MQASQKTAAVIAASALLVGGTIYGGIALDKISAEKVEQKGGVTIVTHEPVSLDQAVNIQQDDRITECLDRVSKVEVWDNQLESRINTLEIKAGIQNALQDESAKQVKP